MSTAHDLRLATIRLAEAIVKNRARIEQLDHENLLVSQNNKTAVIRVNQHNSTDVTNDFR